jgi:hypothetical protein
MHGALLFARTGKTSSSVEKLPGGHVARRAFAGIHWPSPPYQSRFQSKVIDQMKRQQTSFSVEIKKSRTQGQRPHLPPRPLFEVVSPADEVQQILQAEAVPKVAEPTSAPRILPSIVEPMWSRSEPAEPDRRKRSSGETERGQMGFEVSAASEDVNDAPAETPVHAEVDLSTAIATAAENRVTATHDTQPVSRKSAKSNARTVTKNAPAAVEPAQAPEPAPEAQPTLHAEMIEPSAEVPSRSSKHRLTKRLAAASQLPRSERWKRRLHPASWRHQRSKPV